MLITMGLGTDQAPADSLLLDSVTSTGAYLDVAFSDTIDATGPALIASNWSITSPGDPVVISSVSVVAGAFRVYVSAQVSALTYTLNVPPVGIQRVSDGAPLAGPFSMDFSGYNIAPTVIMARSEDARSLEVIFSEPVNEGDASYAGNYSIDNDLIVYSASKVSPSTYLLVTSRQVEGLLYTVTVSNIRDTSGEPMA